MGQIFSLRHDLVPASPGVDTGGHQGVKLADHREKSWTSAPPPLVLLLPSGLQMGAKLRFTCGPLAANSRVIKQSNQNVSSGQLVHFNLSVTAVSDPSECCQAARRKKKRNEGRGLVFHGALNESRGFGFASTNSETCCVNTATPKQWFCFS